MRELCQELTKGMNRASQQGEPGLARTIARSRRCSHSHSASWACSPSAGPWGWSQPSDHEKTTQQGEWHWEGDITTLGVGISQGSARAPCSNAQAGTIHPPSPHDPILPMSSSAAPPKISTYNRNPAKPRAGCNKMTPPHLLKRNNEGRNR